MPHPSTSSAYGIWSLNEVRDAVRGENWPILLTDPDFASVSLLINADGQTDGSTTITDQSGSVTLTSVSGASVDTTVVKYGTGSLQFVGSSGQYIYTGSGFNFGTGDFTIECWARYDGTSNNGIWQNSATQALSGSVQLGLVWYQDKIYSLIDGSGTNTGSPTVSADTWYHLAMVRYSGTTQIYLDGTSIRSVSDTTNYTGRPYLIIGGYSSTPYTMNGYIDDFRVTTGVARYTANFTPPTGAFATS